jgi:hypothetical protein
MTRFSNVRGQAAGTNNSMAGGKTVRTTKISILSAFLTLVLISSAPVYAQQDQGTLTGSVTDSQGAVLQGVQVKVVNKATNLTQTEITNNNGEYTFPELPIGTYRVSYIKDGFKTEEYTEIVLQANRSTTVNASLQTGEVTATVTVTASPLLDKTDPTNGYVLGTSVLETAPVGTGSFTQLTTLSPGVNASFLTGSGTNEGLGNQTIFANGQRGTSNSFSINNVGANNLFNGQSTSDVGENRYVLNTGERFLGGGQIQTNTGVFTAVGEALPSPPLETIEELRVNTAMYDAQQGANAGAHIELITKSGTNRFHGEVYEHFQNSAFNAAPFFFNASQAIPQDQKVPYLDRNAFGGTFGGPIIKDKFFFFASYQRTQAVDDLDGTQSLVVPLALTNDRSAAALAKNFNVPVGSINPASLALLNLRLPNGQFYIPTPTITDPATAKSLGEDATLSQQATFNANQGNGNLDYIVNSKDRLALKYYYQSDPTLSPFAISELGGQPQTLNAGAHTASLTNTTVLSPSLVWEQKIGILRMTAVSTTQNLVTPQSLGINLFGSQQFPGFKISTSDSTIGGGLTFGPDSNFSNAGFVQNQLSFGSTLTWVKGSHSLSFGGNFDIGQLNIENAQDNTAVINFTTFTNFLKGVVRSNSEFFNGSAARYYRYKQAGAYAQDKWKLTPNLTLSLGIRFDYDGPLTEKYGNLTNFNPAAYKFNLATDTVTNSGLVVAGNNKQFGTPGESDSTLNNFQGGVAPRVGVAWSPTFVKNIVVRGGFGIYYDRGEFFTEFSPSAGSGFNGPFGVTLEPPFVQLISPPSGATLSNPFGTKGPGVNTGNPSQFNAFVPNLAALSTGARPFLFGGYDPNNRLPFSLDWSFDIQWQPTNTLVMTLGYVGNHGEKELLPIPFNQPTLAMPGHPVNGQIFSYGYNTPGLTTEPIESFDGGNVDLRTPFVGYSPNSVFWTAEGISNYDALQFSINKRLSHGMQINGSYTYSHVLDEGSGEGLFFNGNNPLQPSTAYGNSDFDRTHVLAISYLYNFPNAAAEHSVASKFVNDWSIAGITYLESGEPYSVSDFSGSIASLFYSSFDEITNPLVPLAPGQTNQSVQLQGTRNINAGLPVLNAAGFTIPIVKPGTFGVPPCQNGVCDNFESIFGDSGRNTFRGPFQSQFNIALMKTVKITERVNFRYRAEVYNLFNTPSFDTPNNNVLFLPDFVPNFTGCTGPNAKFGCGFTIPPSGQLGLIQHAIGSPRFMQMSFSVIF